MALTAATGLLGNISMWGGIPKRANGRKAGFKKRLCPLRHLKETLVYFIPYYCYFRVYHSG